MDFDKSKVYTAVSADELPVGSKCIFAYTISGLRERVQEDAELYTNELTGILPESTIDRFESDEEPYPIAYLIEPPAEPKYKPFSSVEKAMEAIKKHGGWIKCRKSSLAFFIVAYDKKSIRIYISGLTGGLNTEDLYNRYVFADDGSPCGELMEE